MNKTDREALLLSAVPAGNWTGMVAQTREIIGRDIFRKLIRADRA